MAILYCDGKRFKRAVTAGADWLNRGKAHLNRLNVFPVPDGDTGTNMSLTLVSTIKEMENLKDLSLKAVAKAAAWGSLMGARGNSGIILAQILVGFSESIGDRSRLYAQDIATSLRIAAEKAYQAVVDPVEGTMLTVVRETAEMASRAAETERDIVKVLEAMLLRAKASLQDTPRLLPMLREAGVVDAGGLGFVYLLEGMSKLIRSEEVERVEVEEAQVQAAPAYNVSYDWTNRYCTEFNLEGGEIPQAEIKGKLGQLGDSLLVMESDGLLRVHIHTSDPERLFHCVSSFGSISRIKVDDMMEQHKKLLSTPAKSASIIAVALGDGLREIFISLGADEVIEGGQTMNPNVGEILQAMDQVPSSRVILLPNNRNVLSVAAQAAKLSTKEVGLVPSKSIPEGLSALVAFREDGSFEENVRGMEDASRGTKTGEVVRASRDARTKDMEITEGDILGLFDEEIQIVGKFPKETVIALLGEMVAQEDEIITLFYGGEVNEEEAEALALRLEERFPHKEIEIHRGGQPYSLYILSVE